MNAKDLILNKRLTEAGELPPGGRPLRRPAGPAGSPGSRDPVDQADDFMSHGPRPLPGERRPGGSPSRDMLLGRDEPGGMGMPGEEDSPVRPGSVRRGPFSPAEMNMLKDVLLLVATEVVGNDFDGAIARKLMSGAVPEPGELQHILDEAGRIKDLPDTHGKLMQKVYELVQSASRKL